jgi:hypothetical protein
MSMLTVSNEDSTFVPGFDTSSTGSSTVSSHHPARASVMATVGLLLATPGALAVATGVLAAPGAVLGLAGAIFAVFGIIASRHRHIAGRGNAIIGLVLGVAAVAVGVLSITGYLSWLDPGTNQVANLIEWLDANASWATPEF